MVRLSAESDEAENGSRIKSALTRAGSNFECAFVGIRLERTFTPTSQGTHRATDGSGFGAPIR